MTPLPAWYPWRETETKPAPMPLLLLQAFVNTLDLERGEDVLDGGWFVAAGLLDASADPDADELDLGRAMRESIRRLLECGDGEPVASGSELLAPLREVAVARAARLAVHDGGALRSPPRAAEA